MHQRKLSKRMRAARWIAQVVGAAMRGKLRENKPYGTYDTKGFPRRDRPYYPRRWKLARSRYFGVDKGRGPGTGNAAHFIVTPLFQLSDLWIGVYWDWSRCGSYPASILLLYVCVVPCFPIEIACWEARQDRSRIR